MASLDQDIESALLIAQLQLEDALEVSKGRKGKSRAGTSLSDEEIAFQIQQAELGSWKQNYEDYTLAKSLNDAIERDTALLDAYRVMEEAAEADRRTAEAISRGLQAPRPTDAQTRLESRTFNLDRASESGGTAASRPRVPTGMPPAPQLGEEEPLDSIWRFDDLSESLKQGAGPSVDRYKRVQCVGCDTRLRTGDAVLTTCQHYWCSACLKGLIEVYLRDESLHPLRCCKNAFNSADVSAHLNNRRLFDQFDAKRQEYEVPAQNRVYCAAPRCSMFLGSSEAQPIGQPDILCRRFGCGTRTCSTCRNPAHAGNTCKGSEAVEQLRALAREEGWQTCPGCNTVVDLHHGCNHMTCHCRAEFCFLCGVRWKNCACPQWNEDRLLATAQMRVGNELGARAQAAEPVRWAREVERIAENLRVAHDCDPHRWRGTGGGNCEECGDYLPVFLKMCRDCNLTVCRRCSFNRM